MEEKVRTISGDIGQKVEQVYNILQQETHKSTINEIVFVEMFLEFFYNFAKYKKITDDKLLLKWFDLSGSPYNEVDVLDREGKVLFTVPPIYAKSVVISDNLNNGFFNNVTAEYHQNSRMTQEIANNQLVNRLANGPRFLDKSKNKDITQDWINIFKRYNELKINHPNIRYLSDLEEELVIEDEEERPDINFTF